MAEKNISDFTDGGNLQNADQILIARGGGNFKILGDKFTTNLGYTPSATDGTVTSDTGTNATIPLATPSAGSNEAGLLSPIDKDKLDNTSGINTGDEVQATESVSGITEIATQSEVDTGTDDQRIITPLKLRNSSLATESEKSVTQLATSTEYFNKDDSKTITSLDIANDVRLIKYTVGNSVTGENVTILAGNNYNILTNLLEANEAQISDTPITYYDTSNILQTKYLDETNNKYLAPSNLYTYNQGYVPLVLRIVFTVDIPSVGNNQSTSFTINLRRVIDDSIVAVVEFIRGPSAAVTGKVETAIIATFINGEVDPFVVDGFYLTLDNDASSVTSITLQDLSVRIFRG
jgi:hypothetical protein